jgi:hypothetical protein
VVNDVLDEAAAVLWVAAAEADAEAKEDPTLGGCGSGVKVLSRVSQTLSPSGLRLLLRSPKPSRSAASIAHGLRLEGGWCGRDPSIGSSRKGRASSRKALLCRRMRDQTVEWGLDAVRD